MTYTWNMFEESVCHTRNTPAIVDAVPKTSRPAKIPKSTRIRPKLLRDVEERCEQEGLTFNDAVERALEAWVQK